MKSQFQNIRSPFQLIHTMILCYLALAFVPFQATAQQGKVDEIKSLTNTAQFVDPSWQPVTTEEARKFGTTLISGLVSGDVKKANSVIGWEQILDAATRDIKADKKKAEFRKGFLATVAGRSGLVGQITEVIRRGGQYNIIKLRKEGKFVRVLARLILPQAGGFNYHDFLVTKLPDGKVVAADVFIYLSAEMMSTTMRRGFLPVASQENADLGNKLSKHDRELLNNAKEIEFIALAMRDGDFDDVIKTFKTLPPILQKDKSLLLFRMIAAQNIGNKEYSEALAELEKAWGDDPLVEMVSIDAHILKNDTDKALAAIDRLNKKVGGDPYLKILKSQIYEKLKNLEMSKKLIKEAIKEDGSLLDGYWSLLGFSIFEKDYKSTFDTLVAIDKRFSISFADLRTVPEYKDFIKSEYFAKWNAYLKNKPKTSNADKK